MDDLVTEFLTETKQSLGALGPGMVRLEQNQNDRELLSGLFRPMHTIRNTCGFLGLPRLETVARHAENVMGRLRDGDLKITPSRIALIFESFDRIKHIIAELEKDGSEPAGDDGDLIEKLTAAREGRDTNAEHIPIVVIAPPQALAHVETKAETIIATACDHGDEKIPVEASGTTRRVLLVDDSPFFRNMLTPLLKIAGYNVTTLESPLHALKMRESGENFDVIVSDIEMPQMNGFEFAKKVRETGSKWIDVPMLGLTSYATHQDIKHGKDTGFNSYIAKFDRDALLSTLTETLVAGEIRR